MTVLIAAVFALHPQKSLANGFTAGDLLGWSSASQDSYFQTSVTMASFIATQNAPDIASCIDDWYFAGGRVNPRRNDQFREDLGRFPDHHPTAIIIARIEKACGALTF